MRRLPHGRASSSSGLTSRIVTTQSERKYFSRAAFFWRFSAISGILTRYARIGGLSIVIGPSFISPVSTENAIQGRDRRQRGLDLR
jgi:hypothetical protein